MKKSLIVLSALAFLSVGCARIETGEVGIRLGFDKQIKPGELLPGSFNQTIIGDILTFPVKDVSVDIQDMTPPAKDNSRMKEVDVTIIYNINPTQVSELYTTKARSFHADARGDTYLMFNYVVQIARNAVYKAARDYEALDMNDKRQEIETRTKELMTQALSDEGLNNSITISQVLVRSMSPADSVVISANELVRAKNELKQKEVEVKTAKMEAERMAALTNQSATSIAYMEAKANLNYSEAAMNGKVNTIIIPRDFKGMLNVGK